MIPSPYAVAPGEAPTSFRKWLKRQAWRPDHIGDLARTTLHKSCKWIKERSVSAMKVAARCYVSPVDDAIDDARREWRANFTPIDTSPFPVKGRRYLWHNGVIAKIEWIQPDDAQTWDDIAWVSASNEDEDRGPCCLWGGMWHRHAQQAVLISDVEVDE